MTSQPTDSDVVWLTQEAYDGLQHELDQLRGPARAELAAKIGLARDEGDLKENGGYHAAKDEQGKQEGRIRQLTDLLRKARVGERVLRIPEGETGELQVTETITTQRRAVNGVFGSCTRVD